MPSLEVNDGVELHYTDSGVPPPSAVPYKTLFVIHGMGFNHRVYKKVQALAPDANLRVVAITRRSYGDSTPFTPDDVRIMTTGGTDAEKEAFLQARGLEIANFVDLFIQKNDIPPISGDAGGVGILGWSAGNTFTLAAIAHSDKLSLEAQARFASHLRTLILDEPPSMVIGYPLAEGSWSAFVDPSMPPEVKPAVHGIWVTSYWQHGDLSQRDPKLLTHILPSVARRPTIYSMTLEEIAEVVDGSSPETPLLYHAIAQEHVNYRKACFDKSVRASLPHMKIWALIGDASGSFAIPAFWAMEDDHKKHGGMNFKVIPGANHFVQWDEPEKTLQVYLETLA